MRAPREILLVEDDSEHAELVLRAFEGLEQRFRVSVVGSVSAARLAVSESAPCLMITDLKLPDGSGLELLPAERDAAPFAVIVMTSHGDENVAVTAMKAGALDYVVKDERLFAEMPRVVERVLREWGHILEKRRAEHELRQREDELRQAQKMEAIGTLASGVAHDFNNVLTGIIGCADVALSKLAPDSAGRAFVEEIKSSARGAGCITSRLLAFARRRDVEPELIDLNQALLGIQGMLRHLLGSDVELDFDLGATDAHVRLDAGQLDQIVLNLASNARDAMPRGGLWTVCTRTLVFDAEAVQRFGGLEPGPFVVLAVSDTGCGMDEATRRRAFEPFFTTKEIGKGTGLGLSSVYGIARSGGGGVELESRVGQGTTVRLYFPAAPAEPTEERAPEIVPRGRGETILVVEDEAAVRLAMRHYLEEHGHRVLEAVDSRSAAELLGMSGHGVELVVTDVVMPGGGGKAVADSARVARPGVPVVYVSAQPRGVLEREGRIEAGASVLAKPFTREVLLARVHAALRSAQRCSSTRARVLLVEDHRASRVSAAELLRDEGFDVVEAATGREALELCRSTSFDALITDLGLPDLDGTTLAQRIRTEHPRIRVVLTSGTAPTAERIQPLLASRGALFFEKPLDIGRVASGLRELLGSPAEREPHSSLVGVLMPDP